MASLSEVRRVPVRLGAVQETLLVPLLGRAEQTRQRTGLIDDPKAVEIVESLDYDFSKWMGTQSLVGATIRAQLFDREVRDFLDQHPDGTVVEIGAGLNTRYERLDNGRAQWIELDLPDSLSLRRQFFEDTERRHMVAANVMDSSWHQELAQHRGPYCFVSEAVLIYLDEPQVETTLRQLVEKFPGSTLVMDTTSAKMVDGQAKHDIMKHLPPESWFRWKCDDPKALDDWGLRLSKSLSLADSPPSTVAAMPWTYRMMLRFVPALVRRMVQGYRINRFVFET
ncbi:MAG: class I SAM-dependent methyltransferase [Myxococcota bacterium]